MGKTASRQEQSTSQTIEQSYIIHDNQLLLQRKTKKPCTLHRLQTRSQQQTSLVYHNIELYHQIKCSSISKLSQYYELDNSGYCSDSVKFFLIFQGYSHPNVKQEYFYRRYNAIQFQHNEIQAILSAMLCGLQHYTRQFNRKQSYLTLQSLTIDNQTNGIQLRDPWLQQKSGQYSSQNPINFLALYPSPQKILASNQPNIDYNEFKSDLFSIGIFGLQFIAMNFRDDLYVQRKFVDRGSINASLASIGNCRLRDGLAILLSQDPNERTNIYKYWDIRCDKEYRLNKTHVQSQQPIPRTQQQIQGWPSPQLNRSQAYKQQNYNIVKPYYNQIQVKEMPNLAKSNANSNGNIQINTYGNSNWRPQISTVTQPGPIKMAEMDSVGPTLVRQFSKPLEIKNSRNLVQGKSNNVFRKKPNVFFQESNASQGYEYKNNYLQYSPPPNKPSFHQVSPTTNSNTISTNNINPNTLSSNNIPSSMSINNIPTNMPSMSSMPGMARNNITSGSINVSVNSSVGAYKSFQTPRFNYQSPPTDTKSVTSSLGYMNSSVGNQGITSSFNQYQMYPYEGIANNMSMGNNSYQNNWGQSSNSNSPILTKSIISSVEPGVMNLGKNLSEDNTLPYSNTQSLRDTKIINNQQDRNSFSPVQLLPSTLPLSNIHPLNEQSKSSPIRPNKTPSPNILSTDNNQISPYLENNPNKNLERPQAQLQPVIKEQNLPQDFPQPMPASNSNGVVQAPTAVKPQVQSTPPPAPRYPNKYNSTIVQVNEETPNQSSQSQGQGNNDIQFIVEEYDTGSRYEGYKKKGLRHGRGKFYYQDGGYYDGEWKRNQMHGWGKLYYEGGQLAYEGEWAHDQFHGYGKVYNDNPVGLDGGFDYTNFDLLDDYWEFYEGMLANDTKEGRGRIQLTNKQIFQGDFHADRIQGFGKFLRRDGNIVEGIWRDSRLIKILTSNDIYK